MLSIGRLVQVFCNVDPLARSNVPFFFSIIPGPQTWAHGVALRGLYFGCKPKFAPRVARLPRDTICLVCMGGQGLEEPNKFNHEAMRSRQSVFFPKPDWNWRSPAVRLVVRKPLH